MIRLELITADILDALPIAARVARMDAVRCTAERERYPTGANTTPPTVQSLFATRDVQRMDEARQRRSIDVAFRLLLQLDLCSMSSGNANAVLYNSHYAQANWQSPAFRLAHAAFAQYQIVASRIALECFLDLLHVLDTGERLIGKGRRNSKFAGFKDWIMKKDNRFVYFLGHVVAGHGFDRTVRTPEIHGTSRFARQLLQLEAPADRELNVSNDLVNVMGNTWLPLVDILNGLPPRSMSVFDASEDFASAYFRRSDAPEDFDEVVQDLASRLSAPTAPR